MTTPDSLVHCSTLTRSLDSPVHCSTLTRSLDYCFTGVLEPFHWSTLTLSLDFLHLSASFIVKGETTCPAPCHSNLGHPHTHTLCLLYFLLITVKEMNVCVWGGGGGVGAGSIKIPFFKFQMNNFHNFLYTILPLLNFQNMGPFLTHVIIII